MGFCLRECGLPTLHMRSFLNGYDAPAPASRSRWISIARLTSAPRTAYSASRTFGDTSSMPRPNAASVSASLPDRNRAEHICGRKRRQPVAVCTQRGWGPRGDPRGRLGVANACNGLLLAVFDRHEAERVGLLVESEGKRGQKVCRRIDSLDRAGRALQRSWGYDSMEHGKPRSNTSHKMASHTRYVAGEKKSAKRVERFVEMHLQ